MTEFKRKVINFEIRPRLLERLDKIAEDEGLNRSEIIRSLVNGYVTKREKCKCK